MPFAAALCAACASIPEAKTKLEDAESLLLLRQPTPEVVAEALSLANLIHLGWSLPTEEDLVDRRRAPYWRAAAMAFSPPVREARSRALAVLAREQDAGAPGSIEAKLVDHEFGGDDVLVESVATIDLLGLLGVGPAKAERQAAAAESVLALAELERVLWETRIEVDLERARVQAAEERANRVIVLMVEVKDDLVRVQVLEEHGRVSATRAQMALRQSERLLHDLARSNTETIQRRAALADLCGVPFGQVLVPADAFDVPTALAGAAPSGNHPSLRTARLAVSLAEARLRLVAAGALPGIRLGAHLGWPEGPLDPTRIGGLLGLDLPWPGSLRGRIEAAGVERDRAVERYVEALLLLRNAAASAGSQRSMADLAATNAAEVEAAAAQAWTAARARFRTGRASVEDWLDAVDARRASLFLVPDASLALARTELDLAAAIGPPEVTR